MIHTAPRRLRFLRKFPLWKSWRKIAKAPAMTNASSPITADVVAAHGLSEEEYAKVLHALGREPNLVELGIFSVMWS